MNARTPLDCAVPARRHRLFGNEEWNGIDYVDVGEDQKSLCIHFFNAVPRNVQLQNIRISGGRRIRDVRPVRVFIDRSHDADLDDCLRVEVDKAGDLSTYRLCLVDGDGGRMAGIDPRYACIDFNFRIDCAGDIDCLEKAACDPAALPPIEIDYLAKDYASFLRLIYDRLALIMPDWKERHAPDLGVTLVELLAYAGDYLSYYQDAVATEAYLDTARRRISVRRHLRLIDYQLHEGSNARAFVSVEIDKGSFTRTAGQLFFSTDPGGVAKGQGAILTAPDFARLDAGACEIFEPVAPPQAELSFSAARTRILIHDWGEEECCLAAGATSATLVDRGGAQTGDGGDAVAERPGDEGHGGEPANDDDDAAERLDLSIGDFLIFEEVIGPATGNQADADPAHRHVVRLTSVTSGRDELLDIPIVEVGWAEEDALPFALCLSVRRPAPYCDLISNVSVARGNVVAVDHGRAFEEDLGTPEAAEVEADCACEGSIVECVSVPSPFTPFLSEAPLTFAEPCDLTRPAARFLKRDPSAALPAIWIEESGNGVKWSPRGDLLASGPDDRHFVAEVDDEGRGCPRFGDDEHGRRPSPGAKLAGHYRIGNGVSGNVEADAIALLILRDTMVEAGKVTVRNPLPAAGGTDPESAADARLLGPGSIFAERERAVIGEDYGELARRSAGVQGASASLCWTGSWYEARVAIDPLAAAADNPGLLPRVESGLRQFRRIGHDLAVCAAATVPLSLTLEICVAPHFARGHVRAALLDAFSARRTAGGAGFFQPDRLSFGGDIYVSRIAAAAMAVTGVESAKVSVLRRMNRMDEDALETGRLAIGPHEVARLDNDPNFPENGQLELILRGGR